MWQLLPQGGDFFRREKYYPALDRPQARVDDSRHSFSGKKKNLSFDSPDGSTLPKKNLLGRS